MAIIAIIITLLNAISIYTFKLSREIDDLFVDSFESIYNEFTSSYKIFCNIIRKHAIEENQLNDTINNLRKINFKGHLDVHYLLDLKKDIIFIRYGALIGFLFAIISIFLFYFIQNNLNDLLIVFLPFVIFIFEIIFILRLASIEQSLKKIKQKYLNREY